MPSPSFRERSRRCAVCLAPALFLLSAACGPTLQFSDAHGGLFEEEMHLPYALGSSTELSMWQGGYLFRSADEDWRVSSSAPGVLSVLEQYLYQDEDGGFSVFHAQVAAVGVGEAEVIVRNGAGTELGRQRLEVVVPDAIELVSAVELRAGGEAEAVDDTAPVLVLRGGTATFRATYRHGGERVYGSRLLSVSEHQGLEASIDSDGFLSEDRDYLQITAMDLERHELELSVGEVVVQRVQVQGVAADSVTRVELAGDTEDGAEAEQELRLFPRARTAAGAPVHGLDCSFTVGNETLPERGDYFVYELDPEHTTVLFVACGPLRANRMIHARGGAVGDSDVVGCSQLPAPGVSGAMLLVLALLARKRGW